MRLAIIASAAALAISGCFEGQGDTLDEDRGGPPSGERAWESLDLPDEAADPAAAAPQGVTITKETAGGSGCQDPESLTVLIASDGTAFLAIFDQMNLSYPPGPPVKVVNCVASVKVQAPAGWRFSVATASTRGYAYLNAKQTARIASKYYFSGNPPGGVAMSTLDGPHDGSFTFTEDTSPAGWSKCGGQNIFHLHTILTLNVVKNRAEPAILNGEAADARLVKALKWKWEPC